MTCINIFCRNTEEYLDIEGGSTLSDIAGVLADRLPFKPICALVNNKTEGLTFPIFSPKQVEFLPADSTVGRRVYVRSLCMMLYRAVTQADATLSLRIEHSMSDGYFCRLFDRAGNVVRPSEALLSDLKERMNALVAANLPFEPHDTLTTDAIRIFSETHLQAKVELLESLGDLYTTYYTLDGTADSYYGPLAPGTGMLGVFALCAYKEGFLLMPPAKEDATVAATPHQQEKMYDAFHKYLDFNRIIGVRNIGELNEAVKERRTGELIHVAEALHEKYIGGIADRIARSNDEGGARVVFLAGPSSSGKTTTCKRLAVQLLTNCKQPKMMSLDDYFVNRIDTPRDETGDYDYESLYALDLDRLNDDLTRLLDGREINLPTYSFELGERVERERPLRLNDDDVLLIEGIHGLNPELVGRIPADRLFKVYVSALTSLSIDDHNWIPTTDNRLLRRIVRDNKYRHTSAMETIRRWPGVRRGEEKWIFPFQENADATFNSSLLFELAVMKPYAEPLLQQVAHNTPQYTEAYRLLKFLSYFSSIPVDQIPSTSLLREFLGGSSFHY